MLLRLLQLAVADFVPLRLGDLIRFVIVTRQGVGRNAVDRDVLRERIVLRG